MARRSYLLFFATLLNAVDACAAGRPAPVPVEDSSVISLDKLRFVEPRSQALWAGLRDHLLGVTKGWSYAPPRQAGSTVDERWCGPAVPADACSTGRVSMQPQPGWSYATLSQYAFGDRFPEVFGVALAVGDLPADGTWGLQLSLSLRGGSIGGSSLSFAFRRARDGKLTDDVRLGYALSYPVGETTFRVQGPVSGAGEEALALAVEADLARDLASPESFRDNASARLDALLAEVERGIDAHEAKKAVYGAYKGDGRPPPTTLVPLDPVEETAALSKAVAEIGAMRTAVQSDYAAMYARLIALVPTTLPLQR
jgi:hypothetical protein